MSAHTEETPTRPAPLLLADREARMALGLSPRQVRYLVAKGVLRRPEGIGRMIYRSDVERLIEGAPRG